MRQAEEYDQRALKILHEASGQEILMLHVKTEKALNAMSEYAKEQSMAFHLWMVKNNYFKSHLDQCWYEMDCEELILIAKTDNDLYTQFLNDQNKEK